MSFIGESNLTSLSYTVACNYLSTRMTKTCSASQSKFRVLTIKLQVYQPTRQCFSATLQALEGKQNLQCLQAFSIIIVFCFFENQNDKKSIVEFLSDIHCDLLQYAGELRKKRLTSILSAQYLTEEDLHFLRKGLKRLVVIPWLRQAVLVWFKWFLSCTSGLSELFNHFHYCLHIFLQPSSNFPTKMKLCFTWLCKSLEIPTQLIYCKCHVSPNGR